MRRKSNGSYQCLKNFYWVMRIRIVRVKIGGLRKRKPRGTRCYIYVLLGYLCTRDLIGCAQPYTADGRLVRQ
jgi:hypothetical protein